LTTVKQRTLKSDLILLFVSGIWGFAFVAQRAGTFHYSPFTFNGIRFLLGGLCLIPFIYLSNRNSPDLRSALTGFNKKKLFYQGLILGTILLCGASLQQIGIMHTNAGKAGFITGLYVIIVPILGIFWGKSSKIGSWIGAMIALVGLYLLSIRGYQNLAKGDLLILTSTFFWALHVHGIDWFVEKKNAIILAFLQFFFCGLVSLLVALGIEKISFDGSMKAIIPILYAGPVSVGIGFTLQFIGQTEAHPSHAAIILCLEAVFAAVGGWLILSEFLSIREILGCGLMLTGMLLSVLNLKVFRKI
jgi:drug/metabolite transporter (DMT)-like permease